MRARDRLWRDAAAAALYVVATLVMTWPIGARWGGDWVAFIDEDTQVKLWDNWALANGVFRDAGTRANQLFHPRGLDLTFHSISWTAATGAVLLGTVFSPVDAYNLTILITLFLNAYAAYWLASCLVGSRVAAFFAGLVYGFAPYVMAHSGGHPDLVQLASIPLLVLFTMRALERESVPYACAAAGMFSWAVLTSLYVMVFAVVTVGPVVMMEVLREGRLRSRGVQRVLVVLCLASVAALAPRLWVIFADSDALSFAIESKYAGLRSQNDLLSFFTPSRRHPYLATFWPNGARLAGMNAKWPGYLGVLPLGLACVGLVWATCRARVFFWFGMMALLTLLSLGPVLRMGGHVYRDVPLPAALLADFAPIRAVRPSYFLLAALLPLAISSAQGLEEVLRRLDRRSARRGVAIGASVLLLFEFWNGPYPGRRLQPNPFHEALASEPGGGALIDLPMGRSPSKRYMLDQTIHGRPIVEGLSGRTGPDAYAYIDDSFLLSHWRRGTHPPCDPGARKRTAAAVSRLLADGFEYVVVHERLFPPFGGKFAARAAYRDDALVAYRLEELRRAAPCSEIESRPTRARGRSRATAAD